MLYAIELFFDDGTEALMSRLAQKIADEGISRRFLEAGNRPHITLGCFSDVDEELCIDRLKRFAREHKPFPAYIGSVGMFPDSKTVFASPIMTEELFMLHLELHEAMSRFDTMGGEWYLPNRWIPHCALALTRDDGDTAFCRASELVLNEFTKVVGEFTKIGLVRATFPVEEIFTVDLGGDV